MLPALLIIIGIFGRMLPHPMNFTPVLAVALFSGAYLTDRRAAFLLPLGLMLLTDIMLGLHHTMAATWLSMAGIVAIGMWVRKRVTVTRAALGAVSGSVLFFLVTNFFAWFALYEQTWQGLTQCYLAALPFFRNTLSSTVLYTCVLFGAYETARKYLKSTSYADFWLSLSKTDK